MRNVLVVAQVAGSLTLLIVAGCLAGGLANARRMNMGFEPSHLGNFAMDTAYAGYDRERSVTFYRELERRVARASRRRVGEPCLQRAHELHAGWRHVSKSKAGRLRRAETGRW